MVRPVFLLRLAVLLLGLLVCFWSAWNSGREGLAQFFAGYGLMAARLEETDEAVRISPETPEAHYARARLLYEKGELAEAVKEFERAALLRPRDYALWFELGRAREQLGDVAGALEAYRESVRLAPFYAQPRWQLGNTLFRLGRRDEAFAELQRAATSDPKLLLPLLDLLWTAHGEDTAAIERLARAQTPAAHLALARFFLKHGKFQEALTQYRAAGGEVSDEERRALLTELLDAHRFAEAYEVWTGGHVKEGATASAGEGALLNGGFEEPVSLDERGFGWRLPQGMQNVQAAQDAAAPHAGARSLQLSWNGNSNVNAAYLSQLVLVKPNARYELRFAARTEKIVTGAVPEVAVTDAVDKLARPLGKSVQLPQESADWRDYAIDFATGKETGAVIISLRRGNCSSSPCPLFGRAWLDDFSLRRLSE